MRTYGKAPFSMAVIHGGPGAAGEMAPVARELGSDWGVLEPLQTAVSLQGQVEELKTILEKYGDLPVIMIGFSWGAWLSFIVTAKYPLLVRKLILIGCGPFEEKYAAGIHQTRLSRLNEEERTEFESILMILNDPAAEGNDTLLMRLRELTLKSDKYDPIEYEFESVVYSSNIFQKVWRDASQLRRSGKLLKLARHVKCPVIAIHGDYDPHPAEGVKESLSRVLKNFRFILLKNCGHMPWIEQQARDKFYEILKQELRREK